MCGQYRDFHGKGMRHDHHGCGCHGEQHGNGDCHGHGARFGGHGWAFLTHEERIDRLVQAKKDLESQLAEIQKTLNLLQPADKTPGLPESAQEG